MPPSSLPPDQLPAHTTAPAIQPTTLAGQHVELVPLALEHEDGLIAAAQDGKLWELWYTLIPNPEGMKAEIERRLGLQKAGSMLPFTVIDRASGRIAGMTTYMNIDAISPRVEIGSTWYAQSVQKTPLNTEAKLLLLGHAFEQLNCLAVEFRTHAFNHRSRRAIERLGARLDGVLRNHMRSPNGTLRDTYVYSIICSEWPVVRAHLQGKLDRP
ncbi:MAG: GNAT family N-acetyltransferase [Alcaligenaceae bacterium]|nr:GNAT family N-acetyltransferase [Alcaligenaceae bacterium]